MNIPKYATIGEIPTSYVAPIIQVGDEVYSWSGSQYAPPGVSAAPGSPSTPFTSLTDPVNGLYAWAALNLSTLYAGRSTAWVGSVEYVWNGPGADRWLIADLTPKTSRRSLRSAKNPLVTFIGDSTTYGTGSSAVANVNAGSWCEKSIPLINAAGKNYVAGAGLILPPPALDGGANAMWTASGTWASIASFGAGRSACWRCTGAGTLTLNPQTSTEPYDEFYFKVIAYAGNGVLTFTPSDGSTPTVVDLSGIPTGIRTVRVPLAAQSSTTTVAITLTTAGAGGYILGGGVCNSQSEAIRFCNFGQGSARAYGDWASANPSQSIQFIQQVRAKRSIIMLGRNDVLQGIAVSDYGTALTAIVRACQKFGDVAIASFVPSSDATGIANDSMFVAKMKDVAGSTGSQYIPIFEDVFSGTFQAALMNDANHPNNAGYTAIATYFANWWNS